MVNVKRELPYMMPPRVIDALVALGQRSTPFPVEPPILMTYNPSPPMRGNFVTIPCGVPVVIAAEPAELPESEVARIARLHERAVEMVMLGYTTRPAKDPALHAFKYGTGTANFVKYCKKESK